jgi:hypothetical protein
MASFDRFAKEKPRRETGPSWGVNNWGADYSSNSLIPNSFKKLPCRDVILGRVVALTNAFGGRRYLSCRGRLAQSAIAKNRVFQIPNKKGPFQNKKPAA